MTQVHLRRLAIVAAVLASSAIEAGARTCAVWPFRTFQERARWPFNRVLVVRVLEQHFLPFYEGRICYRLDAQLLEDINGIELRPVVRIVSDEPFAVVGLEGEYDACPAGTEWALLVGRIPAASLLEHLDDWGDDVTLLDYYYSPCRSDSIRLVTPEDHTTGVLAAVRAEWRARIERAMKRHAE